MGHKFTSLFLFILFFYLITWHLFYKIGSWFFYRVILILWPDPWVCRVNPSGLAFFLAFNYCLCVIDLFLFYHLIFDMLKIDLHGFFYIWYFRSNSLGHMFYRLIRVGINFFGVIFSHLIIQHCFFFKKKRLSFMNFFLDYPYLITRPMDYAF